MIRRDKDEKTFGDREPEQKRATATTQPSDAELVTAADQAAKDAKPEVRGLIARLRNRLQEKAEQRGVELPGGHTVTAATAQFLREHLQSEYVGATITRMALDTNYSGRGQQWVQYRTGQHAGCATKTLLREFCRLPKGEKGVSEIYMIECGRCLCIGAKLSTNCLRHMEQTGLLAPAGEKLLAEQTAAGKSESEGVQE